MKKQLTSTLNYTLFLVVFLLALSCSNDLSELETTNEILQDQNAKGILQGKDAVAFVENPFIWPNEICAEEEFEFCLNFVPEFNKQGKPQSTNLQVQLLIQGDNPETEEIETEYYLQIFQDNYMPNEGDTEAQVCFNYTFDIAGDYELRYKIGAGGFTDVLVTVLDCNPCDEAQFSYETEDNQHIIFTYNHGEEASSVTLVFTFPQVLNSDLNEFGQYVAADGKIYEVNNPTNQTVFTWTGYVSCKSAEAETFEFIFTADCSAPPANDGQANIWTDAKIVAIDGEPLVDDVFTPENEGPYSLKGDLKNIVFEGCPSDK